MGDSDEQIGSKPIEFIDFPEDVQVCMLSFLSPSEIGVFSCTCKRFLEFCSDDSKVWFALCERRWGSKTDIKKWGSGQVEFKFLYKILEKWEDLMGFWRRIGQGSGGGPLVLFEWGGFYVTGSRVLPFRSGGYQVLKIPFLWMGLSAEGEIISVFDPDCSRESMIRRIEASADLDPNLDHLSSFEFGFLDSEFVKNWVPVLEEKRDVESLEDQANLVSVNISFVGKNHIVMEANRNCGFSNGKNQSPDSKPVCRSSSFSDIHGNSFSSEEVMGQGSNSPGSFPDQLKYDIYQYFANRMSPGADRAARKQKRRDKERATSQGRQKWEAEHFVKIVNCSPTPSCPLQGLWKGIRDDLSLDFYLVLYDDIGGIACRRVVGTSEPFSGYSPVFWTSNTTFLEPPFSSEEEDLYSTRVHILPNSTRESPFIENEIVSRILVTNSSYDLVSPHFASLVANPRLMEGRVWLYENGSLGVGFLQNNFIIDLKHISLNGQLLDTIEYHYR